MFNTANRRWGRWEIDRGKELEEINNVREEGKCHTEQTLTH